MKTPRLVPPPPPPTFKTRKREEEFPVKCKMKACQKQPFPYFFFFQPQFHPLSFLAAFSYSHYPTGPASTTAQTTWVPATCALFPGQCHRAAPHPDLLSTPELHPTHRPGTFPVPKSLPKERPFEQDTSGSSLGMAGPSHTRTSRHGWTEAASAHVCAHTCLRHAHTGQGGGCPGTLGADVTYFSSEASRVAWVPV